MGERARGDVLWEGPVGAELREAGASVQLVALYLWTIAPPYGLFAVTDNQILKHLAIDIVELRKVWKPLEAARVVLEQGGWVWLPLLTQRTVQVTTDPLPYEDARLVAARRWFCTVAVDNPFRAQLHAQFAAAWGLPALELIVAAAPKALPAARGHRELEAFELKSNPQPLLFPEARVDSRELFEAWWLEYPKHRRLEKVRAWAAWSAVRPTITAAICDVMITLLRRQRTMPEWLEEGGKYIPYPAKYLMRGRWLDEVHRVAALPRVDVDNAMAIASWLASKKRKALHE